jgi:hypothetical protein
MAEYGWRNQRKCSIICVLVSFFQKIVLTQSLLLLLYEKIRIGNWCWNLQFIPPINLANILVCYITRFFFVGYYDKMLHLSYGNMIISSFVFLFLNWILQHANNFISTYLVWHTCCSKFQQQTHCHIYFLLSMNWNDTSGETLLQKLFLLFMYIYNFSSCFLISE